MFTVRVMVFFLAFAAIATKVSLFLRAVEVAAIAFAFYRLLVIYILWFYFQVKYKSIFSIWFHKPESMCESLLIRLA